MPLLARLHHVSRLSHVSRLRRSAGLTACAARAAVVVVSGCSASVSSGSGISKTKVAQQISDSLLKQTGHRPAKSTCPGDLHAKVGATERCVITTADASTLGVTVTVSSAELPPDSRRDPDHDRSDRTGNTGFRPT